ncbi:MAG TPA: hypothetical protein VF163_16900, partial [Micromonosporaceae bacterium]
MTITLGADLKDLNFLVGMDFPVADEDALWRCAGAWTEAAAQLRQLGPDAVSAGAAVVAALGGEAGSAFVRMWQRYGSADGVIEQLAQACDELAAACDHAAVEVEYAKIQYLAALVVLAITLAALAASMIAGGVSALGMPAAIAAAQFTIRLVLTRLVSAMVLGATFNLAIDVVAQSIQLDRGHLDGWNWDKTQRAAEDGAIYGAVSGGVLLAGGRWAPGLMNTGRGLLGAAGVSGVAGGVAAPLAHGELPTGRDVVLAMTSSLAGAIGPDLIRGRSSGDGFDSPGRLPALDLTGISLGELGRLAALAPDAPTPPVAGALLSGARPDDGAGLGGVPFDEPDLPAAPASGGALADSTDRPGLSRAGDPGALAGGPDHAVAPARLPVPAHQVATAGPDGTHRPNVPVLSGPVSAEPGGSAGNLAGSPSSAQTGTGASSPRPAAPVAGGGAPHPHPHPQQPVPARPPAVASALASTAVAEAPTVGRPVDAGRLAADGPVEAPPSGPPAPTGANDLPSQRPSGHGRPAVDAATAPDRVRDELGESSGQAGPVAGRLLSDQEAVELVRQTAFDTDAGLAFYAAADEVREFARAVPPAPGFVTLDLHGSPRGFVIEDAVLTPAQFAAALRQLRSEGVLNLPVGAGIKLVSCDTAVGGQTSPAAILARELGVEVVAPDQPVWTT